MTVLTIEIPDNETEIISNITSIVKNAGGKILIDHEGDLTEDELDFQVIGKPQTLAQYNEDLESGNAEIENGNFITAEDLKAEARNW